MQWLSAGQLFLDDLDGPASVILVHAEVRDYWPEHVPEWHETDHDAEGCRHVWAYDTIAFEGLDYVNGIVLQQLRWQRHSVAS